MLARLCCGLALLLSTQILKADVMEMSGLAVDYLGEELYYSVPKMQRISRITMDGAFELTLPIAQRQEVW